MDHAQQIAFRAAACPDDPAVTIGDRTWTYGEVIGLAQRRAGELVRLGHSHSSRVGVLLPTSIELVVDYVAVGLLGATYVPLNPGSSISELDYFLRVADVDRVITSPECLETVPEGMQGRVTTGSAADLPAALAADAVVDRLRPSQRTVSDAAVVIFTSGTSSKAKAVKQSYYSHTTYHRLIQTVIGLSPRERIMCPLPLYAGYGLKICSGTLFSGASLYLLDHFNPVDCLETMERHRITTLFAVPTMISMMQQVLDDRGFDLSSLDVVYTGGSAMLEEPRARFAAASGAKVLSLYGQSECPMSAIEPRSGEHVVGAAGKICPGFDFAVLDSARRPLAYGEWGELAVRGPTLMDGYLGDDAATEAVMDGPWLISGDLGMVDELGYLHVRGRHTDVIIRGGMNISPAEIEEVIGSLPEVREVAVLGVPDELFGQRVKASVVREGAFSDEQTLRAIDDACGQRLAAFKKPEILELRADLPKNHNGKILKRDLVEVAGTVVRAPSAVLHPLQEPS